MMERRNWKLVLADLSSIFALVGKREQMKKRKRKHTFHRLSDLSGRQFDVGLNSRHVRMPSENKVVVPRMALATLRAAFQTANCQPIRHRQEKIWRQTNLYR